MIHNNNNTLNEDDLNYEIIYNSKNHPLYKTNDNNKNTIFNENDWDDTEILTIFDEAIKTHRTKFQEKKVVDKKDITESSSLHKVTSYKNKRKIDDTIESNNTTYNNTNIYNKANKIHSNYLNSYTRSALVHSPELLHNESNNINNNITINNINNDNNDNISTTNHNAVNTNNQYNTETTTTTTTTTNKDLEHMKKLQEDALQSMLLAWYHSGYATGRYEAMKEFGIIDTTISHKDTI